MFKKLINWVRKPTNRSSKIEVRGFDDPIVALYFYLEHDYRFLYTGKLNEVPEKLLIMCLDSRMGQNNQRYFKDYNSGVYAYKSAYASLNSLLKGTQYCIVYKKY